MKRITSFLFFISVSLLMMAQSGPGGVGNSTNLILWLNADSIAGTNGSPVAEWQDLSSQNNDAAQSTSTNQPTLYLDSVNGHNVVDFDGDDFLPLLNNISSNTISIYMVFSNSGVPSTSTFALSTQDHEFASYINGTGESGLRYGSTHYPVPGVVTDKLEMVAGQITGANSSVYMSRRGDTNVYSGPAALNSNFVSIVGADMNASFQITNHHVGNIAEVVVYNTFLNPAQQRILMNSITAKYGSDMINLSEDHYGYQNNFSFDVIGIGALNGSSQIVARGLSQLEISGPDDMTDGEFLMVGHDNAIMDTTSADVPPTFEARLTRVWRADKTGDVGSVDMEFYIDATFMPLSSTYILIDDDGDFTNATVHNFGRSVDANNGFVSFDDVDLSDGAYFTLGVIDDDNIIRSIQSGAWNVSTTWDCSCVPDAPASMVRIVDTHIVDLNTEHTVGSLTIEQNATFNMNTGAILHVFDSLNISGTLNNSGILAANGTETVVFQNNRLDAQSNPIDLYSLVIDNPMGLSLNSSLWQLENSIEIISGSLINDGTFIFNSDQNLTAQILTSVPNSFVGSGQYTMERYISARRAEFANLAAPTLTTIADWDQEIYMSGVGGNDGNAQYTPTGPIYYSVFSYDNLSATQDTVTSTSTQVVPGQGYELFLGDNLVQYTPIELGVINVHGVPVTGDVNVSVGTGWQLLGNPYQAFIQWNLVSKPTGTTSYYYVMNESSGNYQLYDGTLQLIPPSQSFWVERVPGSGTGTVTFSESDKIYKNTNSSTFLRTKYAETDSLIISISNSENPYSHRHVVEINPLSSFSKDENDISYLPSRLRGVPALYSTVTDERTEETKDVMINSIGTNLDEQSIPLHFTAGLKAEFTLQFENKNSIYGCAVLEDKMSGKTIDMTEEESYSFYSEEGEYDRFEIHLKKSPFDCFKKNDGSFSAEEFELLNENGNHFIAYNIGNEQDLAQIRILDAVGRQVTEMESHSIENRGKIQLNTRNLRGIYLIMLQTEDGREFSVKLYAQ